MKIRSSKGLLEKVSGGGGNVEEFPLVIKPEGWRGGTRDDI